MNLTSRRITLLILMLAAVALILFGLTTAVDLKPAIRSGGTPQAARVNVGLAPYVERGRRLRDARLKARFRPDGKPRAKPISTDQLMSEDPRRVALSPAELGWMQKHYYPSDNDLATLSAISPSDVAEIADPRAATLQGLAMLKQGHSEVGIALLYKAAAMGSIYGYEEAAIEEYRTRLVQAGPSDDADDVLRARLEVARILGDYKAEYLIAEHLPAYRQRDHARALSMQQYTSAFLSQLGLQAQALRVVAPGPDPRPGVEQWKDLQRLQQAGRSTTVDIYAVD